MKNRIISLLLTIALVMGMLPTTVRAAEAIGIDSAEGFAAMSSSGSYKLTADITVTAPYAGSFTGTFDGDGHTVTLELDVTSGNAGLFHRTGNGATIKNVVVAAKVTSSVASASYGTGGLIGYVSGSTTIENCGVTGTISSTSTSSSSAVMIGGLVGYLGDSLTMTGCYSTADITSVSTASTSKAGGMIGGMSSAYGVTATNCYCTGNVTARKYAGGFIGYLNASTYSTGKTHTYTNCYTTGTVTGESSKAYGFAYCYTSSGFTFTNCYFNSANTSGACNKTVTGITGKTAEELQALAPAMGDAFQADMATPINNGYPILSWQYFDPTAKYTVTMAVTPANAVLTWNGEAQALSADGTYTFPDVAVGSYPYSVAWEAGDYAAKSGTVTVRNRHVSTAVVLEPNRHDLTFDLTPADAELTVQQDGEALTPTTGHTYSVINGVYTYSAEAFGYQTASGSVTVDRADRTETVALTPQPVRTVTFAYGDGRTDVRSGSIVVTTGNGERTMTATAETGGMVYALPVGCDYQWSFRSANYGKQSGQLAFSAAEGGEETVTIPMTAKTRWEGADDITEPTKDADGVYQISSGSELAWLAQQVNKASYSTKDTYSAVLCGDIDLGGESWTPIGKSSSYAYKGSFNGQGHKISNLSITGSTSGNYGLFGYVNGGTIQALTVAGSVTITGSGSSSYGTGAVVGQLYGTATVKNCLNEATVSGSYNTGGIVGYANGSSYEKTVSGCVDLGAVSGTNNVGGIVGQFSGKGTLENCYSRGTVSATGSKSGGIVGYLYGSSSAKNTVSNCYATGAVTGKSSCAPVFGSMSTSYSTAANCFYLDTLGTDANATGKSEAELKALAPTLGDAYVAAPAGDKDGYPILRWQISTHAVTFTVNAPDAVVTIEGQTGSKSGADWVFALPDGTYDYTVSAYGYTAVSGTVTVSGKAAQVDVTLTTAPRKAVRFAVTPASAAVTVTYGGEVVAPEADGSYSLPHGTYRYALRAKGYARLTGDFTVDAHSPDTYTFTMVPSTAWDGETVTAPTGSGSESSPYLIEDGEQLAWLAKKVNEAASPAVIHVRLEDSIDLGKHPFTPIGSSGHEFSGVFDGQGNTVSGLNVSGLYAGLFGVVKDGEIRQVVVSGTVTGSDASGASAGGIVGRTTGTANTITNCGNEAAVSGGSYSGGILGSCFGYSNTTTITGCYNTGAISAAERAGGILAHCGGKAGIASCYNVGDITSEGYAGGIRAHGGSYYGKLSSCYNAAVVRGSDGNVGAIAPGTTNEVENCWYRSDGADGNTGAVPLHTLQMQSQLLSKLGSGWKSAAGANFGLPVLSWQTFTAADGEAMLAAAPQFEAEQGYDLSGEEIALLTGQLSWDAVEGAERYVISLWQAVPTWHTLTAAEKAAFDAAATAVEKLYYVDETAVAARLTGQQQTELAQLQTAVEDAQGRVGLTGDLKAELAAVKAAQEAEAAYLVAHAPADALGYYTFPLRHAGELYDITGTTADLADAFAVLDEGVYYAAVSAVVDGRYCLPTQQQVEDDVVGYQIPYNRLKAVTGLSWDGSTARWDAKAGFTAQQVYLLTLYTVSGSDYTYVKSFQIPGNYSYADMSTAFAAGKSYAFTVTAVTHTSADQPLLADSLPSGYSDTFTPTADPGERVYEEIWTAADWLELANVEDVPSTDESGSPSKQKVAWEKNYRLMADIDFSTLNAADQTRSKSIGNVTYRFMGDFDGNGKTITGLTLSNNDSGLFWYVGVLGHVHDLTVDSANVLFSDNAAVLVHNNFGTITRCAVVNTNITADTGAVLGGMVSRNYGIIRDSYVQGGRLVSNTTSAVGHAGFVGSNEEGTIERCWTSMDVTSRSAHAGGFVGLGYGGTIRNCFALGDVSADRYSGGFVGRSVYEGNVYENCYAAGVVTVTGAEGNGFIGGNQPDSAFQYDQGQGITNCYYNSATTGTNAYGAVGKALVEMATEDFLTALAAGTADVWTRTDDKNGGLPYLCAVKAPEEAAASAITVELAIASYDKETYTFRQLGSTLSITMDSTGNSTLVDLMDAAQAQGKLTYSYATTDTFGRYIHTINGRAVEAPDGWMFTINDALSNVSASLATVKDGDRVLWFEGTTENRFQGPTWAQLSGDETPWETISTEEQLRALAAATDADTLGKSYRLTADLTLTGGEFPGIGTAAAPFTGVFDGQGHTITNVTVTGGDNVGFFGVIRGATVKGLKLANVTVSGAKHVGGLVGMAGAKLELTDPGRSVASLVGSCSVTGTVSGTESVGGLVGLNQGEYDSKTGFSVASAIDKATADVTVTGTTKTGGLVGENSGTITLGAATGEVTGTSMTGGLVGDSTGDIYDSHADGAVSGKSYTGGFAGYSDGQVKRCYSLGRVTGTDSTGGFAGAISAVDTAISTGTITITGTPTTGNNGAFAGQLGGKLVGLANQITVKNVYANCVDGTAPAGNSSAFQEDSQKAALEAMRLTTWKAVADQLYAMFGVTLSNADADNEANKYADGIAVPADTAANTVLETLKSGQAPSADVTVTYTVDAAYSAYLTGGSALTLIRANDTSATISIPVLLELSCASGYASREMRVTLSVSGEKQAELMDTIAATYTDTTDLWAAMDLAAYGALPGKTASLSDAARQKLLDTIIAKVSAAKAPSASDLSKYEIVLRAIGVDSTRLYPVNSNVPVSNAALLAAAKADAGGYYSAPWVLLAGLQGNAQLPQATIDERIAQLKDNMGEDGLFGYGWGGTTFTSPDTSGAALSALARFYRSSAEARTVVDTILANLPSAMDSSGSFGSANSDAMVILGLLAVGQDPAGMTAPSGASVVDGLLSYLNTATNRFQYNGRDNALATEQAFRALVALARFDGENALQIYDFSTNAVTPGRASGGQLPADPTGDSITVTVTIKSDTDYWLRSKAVSIPGTGATAYHALVKALEGSGISQVGAETGYVHSMTRNGTTLAEFGRGESSGWLYKVNGELAAGALTDCGIEAGDELLWYYTEDWATAPGADFVVGPQQPVDRDRQAADAVSRLIDAIGIVTGDSGAAIQAARRAYDALTDAQKRLVSGLNALTAAEAAYAALTGGTAFVDVSADSYYYQALLWALENGITNGTSPTTFSPELACTRSQMVVFLWRAAGKPAPKSTVSPFTDVPADSYYYQALLWALESGITNGTSPTTFSPDAGCTRSQMVTLLWRTVEMSAAAAQDAPFVDVDKTAYYYQALLWALESGITNGTSPTTFSPDVDCTRGQMVTFLWRLMAEK